MSQHDEKNRGKAKQRVQRRPSVTIGDPTVMVSGRWLIKALLIALVAAALCTGIALLLLQHFHPHAH